MTTTVYHNRLFYLLQRGVHSRSAPGSNFPLSSSLFPRLRSRSPSPSPLPFLSVILSPSLRRRAAQSNEAASLYMYWCLCLAKTAEKLHFKLLAPPARSEAEPRPKSNLMHLALKSGGNNSMIFLKINLPIFPAV